MLFYNAGGNWYSARLYRSPNHEGLMSAVFCIWVIPCQIKKQNAFAFQISTKRGRLVPSGKLLNHAYFGCVKLYGFGVISHSFFQHFGHLAPRS